MWVANRRVLYLLAAASGAVGIYGRPAVGRLVGTPAVTDFFSAVAVLTACFLVYEANRAGHPRLNPTYYLVAGLILAVGSILFALLIGKS